MHLPGGWWGGGGGGGRGELIEERHAVNEGWVGLPGEGCGAECKLGDWGMMVTGG